MAGKKFGLIHTAVVLGDRLEKIPVWWVGVLLAALAAQYVIDGLRSSFG